QMLPVSAAADSWTHKVGMRIVRAWSVDYIVMAEPAMAGQGDPQLTGGWTMAGFEGDARVFFARVARDRHLTRAALVDGTFARNAEHQLSIELPDETSDVFVDLSRLYDRRAGAPLQFDAAGAILDARVCVNGYDVPIAASDQRARRSTVHEVFSPPYANIALN